MNALPWSSVLPLTMAIFVLACFAYLAYDEWRKAHRRRNHRMTRGEGFFRNVSSHYRTFK